jgi:Photoprotection regulator fluorescence recovery protein
MDARHARDNRTEIKCRMEDRNMTSLPSRAASCAGTAMRDLKWSPAEKAIARRAFDRALGRELEAVILETKSKAAKIQEPSGLWELERYLTQRRQEIDRKYDYRYSVLPLVLANLLTGDRLNENELHGLGEDKLGYIHRAAVHL